MKNKEYIIKENPNFIITLSNKTLEIKKDNNFRNNKKYFYKNIQSIYLKSEMNTFSNFFLNFFFSGSIHKNENILVIETKKNKDEYFLIKCDLDKVKKIIEKIKTLI